MVSSAFTSFAEAARPCLPSSDLVLPQCLQESGKHSFPLEWISAKTMHLEDLEVAGDLHATCAQTARSAEEHVEIIVRLGCLGEARQPVSPAARIDTNIGCMPAAMDHSHSLDLIPGRVAD